MKKIFYTLLSFAIFVLVIYLMRSIAPPFFEKIEPKEGAEVSESVDFGLKDTNGQEIKLGDLRGQAVILAFWVSWNEASVEGLKTANVYSKTVSRSEVAVLGIASGENLKIGRTMKEENGIDIPVLLDEEGEVGELYKIGTLPLFVFIDQNGREQARITGPVSVEEIRSQIAALR